MIDKIYKSIRLLIEYIDIEMEKKPTRELADLSNSLQTLYDNADAKHKEIYDKKSKS